MGSIVGWVVLGVSLGWSAPPIPLDQVAPATDLAAEIEPLVTIIRQGLDKPEGYEEHIDKIRQAASVLAVLGQALAEHPEETPWKARGARLRDVAISLARHKTREQAQEAWSQLEQVLRGETAGESPLDYSWAKLTRMHPAMEEINQRAAVLRRALRRPKDPAVESRHASVIAVLALTVHADTHEVKNQDDLPQWQAWAKALQEYSTATARAIKEGRTAEAQRALNAASQTCNQCHEKFHAE